jgi:peptidoglycan/LPS O-acetylase OafA/YrhL
MAEASSLPSFSSRFLAPYRRITSSGQFIPEIDGLRFVAIFSVFIYHLAGDILRHSPSAYSQALQSNWLFSVTQILNLGVPLFFVISGFILGMPFASAHRNHKQAVPLKKYFWRRVTRLEPPYILSLLLFFVLKVVAARGSASELFPHLLASVFYVHNLTFGEPSVINFVAWSLEIEIQFYLLAPALAMLFAIRQASTRRGLLIAGVLLTTLVSRLVAQNGALQHSILGYGQYFLAGFLFVEFYLSGGGRRSNSWLCDAVSLAGWLALLALAVRGGAIAEWLQPWLILALYIAAFHSVAVSRFIRNAWIATIGGMCYTIYLLHNYIVAALGMLTERFFPGSPFAVRLLIQFVLMTPVVLIVSALYFRWIERPCMRPGWPGQLTEALSRFRSRWLLAPAAWPGSPRH